MTEAWNAHWAEYQKLKDAGMQAATADPSKFVPLATFEALKADLVALTTKVGAGELEKLVQQGLQDGKLLPVQTEWARSMSVQQLTAYLSATPVIPGLRPGGQTAGQPPAGGGGGAQLNAEELQVCSQMGLTTDQFIAAKAANPV